MQNILTHIILLPLANGSQCYTVFLRKWIVRIHDKRIQTAMTKRLFDVHTDMVNTSASEISINTEQ